MDLEVLRSQDLPFWGPSPDLGTPSRSGDPLQIWVGTPYGVGPHVVWVHMETSLKAHMTPMDP